MPFPSASCALLRFALQRASKQLRKLRVDLLSLSDEHFHAGNFCIQHFPLLRLTKTKGRVTRAMPWLAEHVTGCAWRLVGRGVDWKGFEEEHLRPPAISHLFEQPDH